MDELRELSLFSGYGGTSLGLSLVLPVRPVCYVEIDGYCQRILQARIADGSLPWAPIWDDITTFDGRPWAGRVDIVTGGFPCQDISRAGKGAGIEQGKRSGLWREMLRVVCEVRPRLVLVENVAALLGRGMGIVLGQLSEAGYDAEWTSVLASDVGAPHRRERIFILAHDNQGVCGASWPCQDKAEPTDLSQREGAQGRELADAEPTRRGTSSTSACRDKGQDNPDSVCGREEVPSGLELGREELAHARPIQRQRVEGQGIQRADETCGEAGASDRQDLWPLGYGPEQHEWEPPRLVANRERERLPERVVQPCVSDKAGCRGQGKTAELGCSVRTAKAQSYVRSTTDSEPQGGPTQPRLGRNAHGRSRRVDRLKALGNGILPQQLARAITELLGRTPLIRPYSRDAET